MRFAPILLATGCIVPTDPPPAPIAGEVALVRVESGDCLSGIADRLSFPGGWRSLSRFNHLEGDRIRAGSELRVPVEYLRAAGIDPLAMHLAELTPPLPTRPLTACRAEALRGSCVTGSVARVCLASGPPRDPLRGDPDQEPDGALDFPERASVELEVRRGEHTERLHVPNDQLAGELAGYVVDLDGDGRDELVAVVPISIRNHMGMAYSRVFVIGETGVNQLDVAQWGVGSLIEGDAGHCDVLATDWEDLDHPLDGSGLYLVGRPLRYDHGALVPRGDEVVRRMRTYFHLSDDDIDRPAEWLADSLAEWWNELAPDEPIRDQHIGTLVGLRPIAGGVAADVELVTGVRIHLDPSPLDDDAASWRLSRFGWAANATLFPTTFIPADPDRWIGASVVVTDEHEGIPTHTVWISPR